MGADLGGWACVGMGGYAEQLRVAGAAKKRMAAAADRRRSLEHEKTARAAQERVAAVVAQILAPLTELGEAVAAPPSVDGFILDTITSRQLSGSAEDGKRIEINEPEPKEISINHDIKPVICEYYGITYGELISVRRLPKNVWARHVGMYLSKKLTGASFPAIARLFRKRDHTTVMHAVRKIQDMAGDPAVSNEIDELKRAITARSQSRARLPASSSSTEGLPKTAEERVQVGAGAGD